MKKFIDIEYNGGEFRLELREDDKTIIIYFNGDLYYLITKLLEEFNKANYTEEARRQLIYKLWRLE